MCNRNIVALNRIKAIVDAYKEERIHISVIMGIISNHINDAFSNYEK